MAFVLGSRMLTKEMNILSRKLSDIDAGVDELNLSSLRISIVECGSIVANLFRNPQIRSINLGDWITFTFLVELQEVIFL